jgi:hypothetical protein
VVQDYLGIENLYCQQIYDAFRPYILRLQYQENVILNEAEYIEALISLGLIKADHNSILEDTHKFSMFYNSIRLAENKNK